MAGYFFIQSMDSLANSKTDEQFRLMEELADRGNKVQVLLVQDAVFMAKNNTLCRTLDGMAGKGIKVYVDDFSLAQRGITTAELKSELQPIAITCVVDAMLAQQKVIWN
jgi:sulfur relay protein TusB/DsrH